MEAKECDVDTGRGAKDLEDKMAAATIGGGIGVAPEARRVGNGFRICGIEICETAAPVAEAGRGVVWEGVARRVTLATSVQRARLPDCLAMLALTHPHAVFSTPTTVRSVLRVLHVPPARLHQRRATPAPPARPSGRQRASRATQAKRDCSSA